MLNVRAGNNEVGVVMISIGKTILKITLPILQKEEDQYT